VAKKKTRESDESSDRDDLIEAGRRLRKAKTREAQEATASSGGESGTGVKSCKKAWDNHYPGK
jgi:hypothetical protein